MEFKGWRYALTTGAMIAGVAGLVAMVFTPTAARADSCWNHNGSTMRLKADGNSREFYYEEPKSGLSRAGVRSGTLLFNGSKNGNWYSGTARVFSRHCPGSPLEYFVEGPVRGDQLQVTVSGRREIFERCQPTGNFTTDTLVFTHQGDCIGHSGAAGGGNFGSGSGNNFGADGEEDNEENNASSDISCTQFGAAVSRNSGQSVSIQFTNRTNEYRSVMWLDYNGQPVEYKNLNPGESYVQQTFVDHPWMITDGPGNCKEIFNPRRSSRFFDITFE